MKDRRTQEEEQVPRTSFQFSIWQIMFWTVAAAVVFAVMKLYPLAAFFIVVSAAIYVLIGPFVILFITIAAGPERNGSLSLDYGPTKFLIGAWIVCVVGVAAIALIAYAELI